MKKDGLNSFLSRYATLFCAAFLVLSISACSDNASSNSDDGAPRATTEEEARERCDQGQEEFCTSDFD